jgi:hypothetical protein
MVFIDDILIYSKMSEEHEKHLWKALERLRREQLYAKLEKCEFWLGSMSFLGHVVYGEGVVVDSEKVKVVVEWTRPTSIFKSEVSYYSLVIIDASSRVSRSCSDHSLP